MATNMENENERRARVARRLAAIALAERNSSPLAANRKAVAR